MKKIYIQEIEKNGQDLNQPGPDKYEPPQTFGKKGIHYTMRPDISRQESKHLLDIHELLYCSEQHHQEERDVAGSWELS